VELPDAQQAVRRDSVVLDRRARASMARLDLGLLDLASLGPEPGWQSLASLVLLDSE
jgi:hypothetical protein